MLMFTATARRSHPELFICCFHSFVFLCFCLLLFFVGILLSSATSAASSLSLSTEHHAMHLGRALRLYGTGISHCGERTSAWAVNQISILAKSTKLRLHLVLKSLRTSRPGAGRRSPATLRSGLFRCTSV